MVEQCLKYIDDRPVYIPKLKNYPGGVVLPGKNNIIKVSNGEMKNLLRIKNGHNACFEFYQNNEEA